MNKMISAAAAVMLAVSLTGCGSAKKSRSESSEAPAVQTEAASAAQDTVPAETESEVELETVRKRDIVSDNELYDYEIYQGGAILTKYKGNEAFVTVPSEMGGAPVKNIGFYCFEAKYSLQSVVLPDTLTTISEFAFSDCAALTSVNIPAGVTEIQRGAFAACSSLTNVTLPESVATVNEEAFTGCGSLTSLTVMSPSLKYENWGLEDLEGLTVYAPAGSEAETWASAMGKYSPIS